MEINWHNPAALNPGTWPFEYTRNGAGWAPGLAWTSWKREISVLLSRIKHWASRFFPSGYAELHQQRLTSWRPTGRTWQTIYRYLKHELVLFSILFDMAHWKLNCVQNQVSNCVAGINIPRRHLHKPFMSYHIQARCILPRCTNPACVHSLP